MNQKQKQQHSPEPWETPGEDGGERVISCRDSRGRSITIAHAYDGERYGSMEPNARHIVACVNACAGIPDSILAQGEGAVVPGITLVGVMADRDRLSDVCRAQSEQVADLQAQRERLREALSLAANALITERANAIAGLNWADGQHASSTRLRAERELLANTPSGCQAPLFAVRAALSGGDQ